jgi:hypothetical protein
MDAIDAEFARLAWVLGHDAFRHRGLGKSALQVWEKLRLYPSQTPAELAASTGRGLATVRRVLARLERIIDPVTGEVFKLVERDVTGCWQALDVDIDTLDAIARAIGTAGAGERQKAKHAEQRAGFARAIARQHAGDVPRRVG